MNGERHCPTCSCVPERPVPEFKPAQNVAVTRENTAHAVNGHDDRTACGRSTFFMGKVMRMTWSQTRDVAYKPWPAWPCQSCVRQLNESARAPSLEGEEP